MNKTHLKITLISILITSTLFNSANDNIADANEDTDENYQEENDINDRTEDILFDEEWNADDVNEGGSALEEESPVEPADERAAEEPQGVGDETILTPADHVEEEEAETSETIQEEPLPAELEAAESEERLLEEPTIEESAAEAPEGGEPVIVEAEEPAFEEPAAETPEIEEPVAEDPVTEEPIVEEPAAEEPIVEEPVVEDNESDEGIEADPADGHDREEQDNTGEPDDGSNMESGIDEEPAFEASEDRDEPSQPEQYQPAQYQPEQDSNFTDDQPVEAEQNESLETYEYHYEEPAGGQPADDGSWNTQEYGGAETEETLYEARPGTAGKKLHRYDYGDILSGISFSPGESDESLALLDKRVNRIMTSKIIEEDEVSKEDIMKLEEEIKNESGITSSDREVLPNTGEASNYNYLYSIMLIAAGTTLFFVTKRPRQQ